MSGIVLGVDPDLHATAFVWLGPSGVLDVRIARVAKKITGDEAVDAMCDVIARMGLGWRAIPDLVVVEGQQIVRPKDGVRSGHGRASPVDLFRLAQVAGAARCATRLAYSNITTVSPTPAEWKGQVPKEVHQARVLKDQGWETTEAGQAALATRWPDVRAAEWLHAVDALGLAQWGRKKLSLAALVARTAAGSSAGRPSRTPSPVES